MSSTRSAKLLKPESTPHRPHEVIPVKRDFQIMDAIVESQQISDKMQKTTDVNLICSDGMIPVHAAVLQAVSPFFAEIFYEHRYFWLETISVILPDYVISDVRKVVEMIYHGKANISSKQDAENIKEIIRYFEIKITTIDFLVCSTETKSDLALLTYPSLSREKDSSRQRKESKNAPQPKRHVEPTSAIKSLRPRTNMKKFTEPPTDSDEDYADEPKRPRRQSKTSGRTHTRTHSEDNADNGVLRVKPNQPVAEINQLNPDNSDKDSTRKTEKVRPPPPPPETSDEDDEKGRYKNLDWFHSEARRCQVCKKECGAAAAASQCLTSHNRLRCYYCFRVVKNTEKLFKHFAKRHKQAGRENCLMCPFCEQSVPYKSVSCHVISMHLQNPATQSDANRRKAGEPITVATVAGSENTSNSKESSPTPSTSSVSKKRKARLEEASGEDIVEGNTKEPTNEKLILGDLDYTISRLSICGKTRIFHLKKVRPATDVIELLTPTE